MHPVRHIETQHLSILSPTPASLTLHLTAGDHRVCGAAHLGPRVPEAVVPEHFTSVGGQSIDCVSGDSERGAGSADQFPVVGATKIAEQITVEGFVATSPNTPP